MTKKSQYQSFGELIVKKLRDESFSNYEKLMNFCKKLNFEEYQESPKNPNIDDKLQANLDENIKLLCSLTDTQKEQLDRLILKILDETAFGFLREVEESELMNSRTIGFTYEGEDMEGIRDEFLSGTYFGEYFLWVKNFSKYGDVQEYQ
jgi:hypothetical protein